MSGRMKRPTHESDAMKLFLSDSVAPSLVPRLVELEKKGLKGDALFVASALSLSMERDREWWSKFADTLQFESALLEYLEGLHREGKSIKKELLQQIQQRYAETIAPFRPKSWIIWKGAFDVELFEFSKEKYIVVKGQGFRFEIPVEG